MSGTVDTELSLKFDPLTIEHLGYKMYSHLPNALAELIANAYDADATVVRIILNDAADGQAVMVQDDGHGMDVEDLNDKYLRIGRNRRVEGEERSESGRRNAAGKKGLGKLALFGIGETIELRTRRRAAREELLVRLDWSAIREASGHVYHPELSRSTVEPGRSGTTVTLRKLRRRTPVIGRDLAMSIGRLFNYLDEGFRIEVVDLAGETHAVDRSSRLDGLDRDIEWTIPNDLSPELLRTLPDPGIRGRIVAATRPVPPEQRGIALFAHGRLANEPEFFGVSESSYAFSYLTGYLDVDHIDEQDADVISTDRRSVSWDNPTTAELREYLRSLLLWISRERRAARRDANRRRLRTDHGVDVDHWVGTIKGPEQDAVRTVAEVLTSPDSQIEDGDRDALLTGVRTIAPDYADLHWRHLHPRIRSAAEKHYRAGLYHSALSEALKRYVNDLRLCSAVNTDNAAQIVDQALNTVIDVSGPYHHAGLGNSTLTNIKQGQHQLSKGAVSAFRNPLAHEEEAKLVDTDALTHRDCLDGLSILSHLYSRFDRSLTEEQRNKLTGSGHPLLP